MCVCRLLCASCVLLAAVPAAADGPASGSPEEAVGRIYRERCAPCHGERRYGGYAPPLIPDALARKDDTALATAIRQGLPNTQMPAFADAVSAEQVDALVRLLRTPVADVRWSMADIAASRVGPVGSASPLPESVRREDLTLVVERGRSRVSVLDGDTLAEVGEFHARNLHGGLKFDQQWRRVYAATRDGTVLAYDLANAQLLATAKVGVNSRNVAISPDGEFVAVANQLPPGLVLLDAGLHPLALFALEGQPSAVYHLPGTDLFALAMRDVPVMHLVRFPALSLETIALPEPFEDFAFVPGTQRLVASSRGGSRLVLWDYVDRAVIKSLETEGLPHLFSACFFVREGVRYAAFNHIGVPRLSIVDVDSFEVRREIELRGSGYFARTHPATPYVWVDTNTDTLQLVRKDTLALAPESLTPQPGKKAMHVEFDADGAKAFVSVWDPDGAVVVYDSRSLGEIARIPYAMPVGKYNATNKTGSIE